MRVLSLGLTSFTQVYNTRGDSLSNIQRDTAPSRSTLDQVSTGLSVQYTGGSAGFNASDLDNLLVSTGGPGNESLNLETSQQDERSPAIVYPFHHSTVPGPSLEPDLQNGLELDNIPWNPLNRTMPVTPTHDTMPPPPRKKVRTDNGVDSGYGASASGAHRSSASVVSVPLTHPGHREMARSGQGVSDTSSHLTPSVSPGVPRSGPHHRPSSVCTLSQTGNPGEEHFCHHCNQPFKTPAEYKKHMIRHDPQFYCRENKCNRTEGFGTKNDLDRHLKAVHNILKPGDIWYKCLFPGCAKGEKLWPRQDNFKAHIFRMHGPEFTEEYIKK